MSWKSLTYFWWRSRQTEETAAHHDKQYSLCYYCVLCCEIIFDYVYTSLHAQHATLSPHQHSSLQRTSLHFNNAIPPNASFPHSTLRNNLLLENFVFFGENRVSGSPLYNRLCSWLYKINRPRTYHSCHLYICFLCSSFPSFTSRLRFLKLER